MRRSGIGVLLSTCLAMSVEGCASLEKKPANEWVAQHNTTSGEEVKDKETSKDDAEEARAKHLATSKDFNISFIYGGTKVQLSLEHLEKETEWERRFEPTAMGLRKVEGDGRREYRQWTDKELVHHVEIRGPSKEPYVYVAQTALNGTKTILYDADGDGKIDRRIEKNPEAGVYIIERDSDGDGVFDERVTNTVVDLKNHRVFETRKADGSWKKILERTERVECQGIE